MKYFIQTFGCQQNTADSQRIAGYYQSRGYSEAESFNQADVAVINTCVVRQQAEDRVYGLVKKLLPLKKKNPNFKIIVTGCLVGAALREPTGQRLKNLHQRLPQVDEFLPIEEVGFEYQAIRKNKDQALVPISNGCNNFCTFCIVPFSRGREHSRPFAQILTEVEHLAAEGCREIMLIGQNVNSYGADLVKSSATYELPNGTKVKPILVKHLGRYRLPTLFPHLLEQICQIKGLEKISFISSNPWDFSDELIEVIAKNPQINREIHLPIQSGDNEILRRMNRWYTAEEYLNLVKKIKTKIPEITFTTDIIVGFPGETSAAFENTIKLAQAVGFSRAFIACYSPRLGTAAAKTFPDDVSRAEKKQRFHQLDKIINAHLRPDLKLKETVKIKQKYAVA